MSILFAQRRPTEQIVAAVERVIPNEEFNAFYKDVHLPTMKFLPKCYVFETGLKVNLRPAGKDDMPLLYALMTSVTGAGQGYGVDEFPTLNAFLSMTSDAYNIVVEERSSRKVRHTETLKRFQATFRKISVTLLLLQPLLCDTFARIPKPTFCVVEFVQTIVLHLGRLSFANVTVTLSNAKVVSFQNLSYWKLSIQQTNVIFLNYRAKFGWDRQHLPVLSV